ncbi:MAG TPA: protein ndvB, partial [Thiolinea sp.]|nr:protein ndvB [Thiolinea sp.]
MRLQAFFKRQPLLWYLGGIGGVSLGLTLWLMWQGLDSPRFSFGALGLAVLVLLTSSYMAVSVVNWLTTVEVKPKALPRLDFSDGIPPDFTTLVAIPTLLTSKAGVESLLEGLEIRFLANRSAHLYFALLTDFKDAASETLPQDAALIALAQDGIAALNAKYAAQNGSVFFLLHRPRQWSAEEQCWMGFERKRGKLAALNALLRGDASAFSTIVGELGLLQTVKYVITLDTDTQLPRDAAYELVGAMAHPLNQPLYDPLKRLVVKGYSILQPRMVASISGANSSRYAQWHSGESGIDPYTRAVSDVYQDLCAEGSFIGKGIYEVDSFERCLHERFPNNRILSHDLLEGCYTRSGLLSDVPFYEDYPARYSADMARRHRWVRGDWQIARWLMPTVPTLNSTEANPLSLLSRWKIFDNLRRSLIPLALVLLLSLVWTALPNVGFWTIAVVGILLLPSLSARLYEVLRKPADLLLSQHLSVETRAVGEQVRHALLVLTCLPYEAYSNTDAIVRTLWRLWVSKRGLLEWNPSSEANQQQDNSWLGAWQRMWSAPATAVLLGVYLAVFRVEVLWIAAPILLLWLSSPAITWRLSQAPKRSPLAINAKQTQFFRLTARRTWRYFSQFVTEQDHWLPPDNYQEYGAVGLAHRTSPTNIGLSLLANLTAHDFGYITTQQLLERTHNT